MTLLRVEKYALPPAERREEQREKAMVPVSCCDWLEAALASQLVEVARSAPAFYLRRNAQHWAIKYCPGCGERLGPAEHQAEPQPTERERFKFRRTCGMCKKSGHDARTCPGFDK